MKVIAGFYQQLPTCIISFLSEVTLGGKVGYTIYEGGIETTKADSSIREKLVKFSSYKKLELNNQPLKIAIFLEPTEESSQVTVELRLLNESGKVINKGKVIWRKEASPEKLKLVAKGKISVKEKEPILLQIINQVDQAIDPGKAKLQVKRIKGLHARIVGATYVNGDTQEISLEKIDIRQEINKSLIVEPNGETSAAFSFQLLYEGKQMGKAIEINWEREELVRLKEVKYDPKTRHITCKLKKTTYQVPDEVKIIYKSERSGIKLGGKDLLPSEENTVDVGYISVYGNSTKDLGELVFGSNREVEFKFKLKYEGGETSFVSYTFTAANIHVGLKIDYDPAGSQVNYKLTNIGQEEAKNVKLLYKNLDAKGGEKAVLLADNKEGEITSIRLAAKTGVATGQLPIRFNGQEKATFEFMVAAEGIILTHLTQKKDFKAPEVNLNFVPINGNNVAKCFNLKGNNKEAKFKIVRQKGSGAVDLENLKVVINRKQGNKGFLSTNSNGISEVKELTGDQLGNIDGEIKLYVIPNGEKELQFEIILFYKDQQMGYYPLTVNWEEGEANLKLIFVDFRVPDATISSKFKKSEKYLQLEEPAKSIQVQIEPQPESSDIDHHQLKLVVTQTLTGKGFLTKAGSNTKIAELIGAELGSLGEELTLDIHPEGDEQLEFRLQLFYKGTPMGDPLTVSWHVKKVKLQLVMLDPKPDAANLSFMNFFDEAIQPIKVKIIPEPGVSNIDKDQIKLKIARTVGTTGFLSTTEHGNQITEIVGNQLGNIGEDLNLYFHPKQDEYVKFEFKLLYKGVYQSIPLILEGKKDKIEITEFGPSENHDEITIGKFRLSNTFPDAHAFSKEILRHIQVTVNSNNGSKFKFLNQKDNTGIGETATLDQFHDPFKCINFQLVDAHGQDESIITLAVSRVGDSTPLDSKKITWKNKLTPKVLAYLNTDYAALIDDEGSVSLDLFLSLLSENITLFNISENEKVNVNDIKFRLINSKGLTIALNGQEFTGDIDQELKDVLGQEQIDPQAGKDIKLQIKGSPTRVNHAELVLQFVYKDGGLFYENKWDWNNVDKVRTLFQDIYSNKLDYNTKLILCYKDSLKKYISMNNVIMDNVVSYDKSLLKQNYITIPPTILAIKKEATEFLKEISDKFSVSIKQKAEFVVQKNILAPIDLVLEYFNEQFVPAYIQYAENEINNLLQKLYVNQANKYEVGPLVKNLAHRMRMVYEASTCKREGDLQKVVAIEEKIKNLISSNVL